MNLNTTTTTAAERKIINDLRARVASQRAMNTNPPAGYEAKCPTCGKASHATLVARFGHCMACHQVRVA